MLQRRTTHANELVISYLLLRKLVGWIGMLLPFVLMVGNVVMSEGRPDSMSGYYYTPMRNIFVGSLCALGVFLIAYDGYDDVDRWITNIAGFCAIGVAFCPTKPSGHMAAWQNVVGDVHVVFAIGTFAALGLMALRFAKHGPKPEIIAYRVCGSLILACVVLAAASNFLPSSVFASWPVLFILEALAVVAFGVSWFVKGTTIKIPGRRAARLPWPPMPGNPMPAAEVDVTADLVRRLLDAQHPDLARLPLRFLANGWDNVMFRVGDELIARLPRREMSARILVHEQRWLPLLAAGLPLPIPYPERTGAPAHGYPWPWSIVPYLPGRPASAVDGLDVAEAATAVGGFLGALHVPAPARAPVNPFRGVPLQDRAETFAANLRLLAGAVDERAVRRAWAEAIAAPRYDGPPVWLHGDLHPANILIHDGRVSGVIDFGDITSGDPAADLGVAWMLLPAGWHDAFRDAYHAAGAQGAQGAQGAPGAKGAPDRDRIDDALWTRARGWALNLAVVFLAYSAGNPQLLTIGRDTLRALLG